MTSSFFPVPLHSLATALSLCFRNLYLDPNVRPCMTFYEISRTVAREFSLPIRPDFLQLRLGRIRNISSWRSWRGLSYTQRRRGCIWLFQQQLCSHKIVQLGLL